MLQGAFVNCVSIMESIVWYVMKYVTAEVMGCVVECVMTFFS